MVLTVTLNPSVDHALFVDDLLVGDTNRVKRVERDAGGKGVNLSRVFAELGGATLATGFVVGGPGAYIRSVLTKQKVDDHFVTVSGETRINFSVETAAGGLPTTFNEAGPEIAPDELENLVAVVRELSHQVSWVVLGGSIPPGVPADIFRTLGRLAHSGGARLLIDADGEAMLHGLEANPQLIKPNEKEAARLLGWDIVTTEDAIAGAKELYSRMGQGEHAVIISRGAHGAVLCCSAGIFVGTSPQVPVVSTIGSGDSMLAGVLYGLETGQHIATSLKIGLAAGAATAMTDGANIGNKADIQRLFEQAVVRQHTEPAE